MAVALDGDPKTVAGDVAVSAVNSGSLEDPTDGFSVDLEGLSQIPECGAGMVGIIAAMRTTAESSMRSSSHD